MIKKILTILFFIAFIPFNSVMAEDFEPTVNDSFNKFTINLLDSSMKVSELSINFNITVSQIEAFNEFIKAENKFKHENIEVAYSEFRNILKNIETSDFGYVLMSNKLAEYGLFYLSNIAAQSISDKEISQNHIDSMKIFFYPKVHMNYEDETYLAEAYSNIMFNDKSHEVMEELQANTDLLEKYDYANYVLALAAFKAENIPIAKQYIQLAILKNPQNLNYKILDAKITANGLKPNEALKIVKQLKKDCVAEAELKRRVDAVEQYVLYKIAKKDYDRNYHLGYYYFYERDFNKSIKTLQATLTKKKKNNAKVNALLSQVYWNMKEYEKAFAIAKKSVKVLSKNPKARMTLGNSYYVQGNYKKAIKNYKIAAKDTDTTIKADVEIARTYQKMGEENKAKELYTQILTKSSDEYEAYYSIAMMEPYKKLSYLKKALGINITFIDAWLGLAGLEINRDNFAMAQDYLSVAYYINQNDFRYYYYQGLIYKSLDDLQTASMYFNKCLKLNPNFAEAQKELKL